VDDQTLGSDSTTVYTAPPGEATDPFGYSIEWCPPSERTLVNDLSGIEAVSIDEDRDGISWKYRPYPIARFGAILQFLVYGEDLHHMPRPRSFLEVGCGVGTKVVLAAKMFGLKSVGIDIFPEYVESAAQLIQAHDLHAAALLQDATSFAYYHDFDIIFCNSPLWSWDDEHRLEVKILSDMKPGAVIMLGNAKVRDLGWRLLTEEIALPVYQKPLPSH
jgi:SAM-dependent methyltransferase